MGENNRLKNSINNIISVLARLGIGVLTNFLSRTIFIMVLGSEYLGINGLFTNILSLLSLSELGIGTAITFYLYTPIANNDIERIKSLMHFYKVCYRVVGSVMLGLGIAIMPFLPYIVNFEQNVDINLYFVYFLFVLNVASSYFVGAYKQTLIVAYQKQYKLEKYNMFFLFLGLIFDVLVLLILRDYVVYLVGKIIITLAKNIAIALRVDNIFPFLKDKNYIPITKTEIVSFFKSTTDVAVFNIGSQLFYATDNIIISVLLGTVWVGYYSNYALILSLFLSVYGLFVKAFSASIGNIVATEKKEKQYTIYKDLNTICNGVLVIISVCLCQCMNSFMQLWVGNVDAGYILQQEVVFLVCFNYYIMSSVQLLNVFKEASGIFYVCKYNQLIGGMANIVLSILLGMKWGLIGIFAATILSELVSTYFSFIYGVAKSIFPYDKNRIIFQQIREMVAMLLAFFVSWSVCQNIHMTTIGGLFLEALCAFGIAAVVYGLINVVDIVPVIRMFCAKWKQKR